MDMLHLPLEVSVALALLVHLPPAMVLLLLSSDLHYPKSIMLHLPELALPNLMVLPAKRLLVSVLEAHLSTVQLEPVHLHAMEPHLPELFHRHTVLLALSLRILTRRLTSQLRPTVPQVKEWSLTPTELLMQEVSLRSMVRRHRELRD